MKPERTHLVIRADASAEKGVGHVMRCLALAQSWQDFGGKVTFIMGGDSDSVESRVSKENIPVLNIEGAPGSRDDASELVDLARGAGASWLVLDGYHFCSDYQRAIKKAGMRLLCLDDYGHCEHYFADFVLNQNFGADEKTYEKRESYTRLLLGTKYTLLRREFMKYRDWERRAHARLQRILVTMGGGDKDNATAKVLDALETIRDVQCEIVVAAGGANPHLDKLLAQAEKMASSVEIYSDVEDMSDLLAWADLALAAGGSTCWEILYMQLPAVLIVLAENQRGTASSLGKAGFAVNLGWHADIDANDIASAVLSLMADINRRRRISKMGRELVDSLGAARVVELMKSTIDGSMTQ